MTKHLHAATMPDFFGKRFDSNALRIAASAIVFIFLVPYTASIYNGLSRLFELAFDVPYAACMVVMAALTGAYVILGGYMATAINDFIQGIIMLFGIAAVIGAVLSLSLIHIYISGYAVWRTDTCADEGGIFQAQKQGDCQCFYLYENNGTMGQWCT